MKNTNKDRKMVFSYQLKKSKNFGFADKHGTESQKREVDLLPGESRVLLLEPENYYESYTYKISTKMKQAHI